MTVILAHNILSIMMSWHGTIFRFTGFVCGDQAWAPFHLGFFHRNSNSMEILFHSHLDSNTVIATTLCTWHDSCAVVACANICCDLITSSGITARRSVHRIWIADKKTLVKRAPELFIFYAFFLINSSPQIHHISSRFVLVVVLWSIYQYPLWFGNWLWVNHKMTMV